MAAFTSLHAGMYIPRPRLSAALVRWREMQLICVVAPTGYGKSTFAASWLAELADLPEDSRPITAWMALEPAGVPVDVALQRLAVSLRSHLPAIDALLEERASDRISVAQLIQHLVAQVGRLDRHFIAVIDDLHLLTDPAAFSLLTSVLDAAPPNLHFVLLSRTQPALHFTKFLLRNSAILLDEHHMRLDQDEFTAFVRNSRLAALDAAQLADIQRRCEGWIAALQLLALSLPESTDANGAVGILLGPRSGQLLLEHLEHEVFVHLSGELQQFLTDVAPLPFLTPEFVAAATLRDAYSCTRLLQQALDANVFLTVVTGSEMRLRFHPLFRELLLQKLLSGVKPADIDIVTLRSADWLASHGEVDGALALLLPARPNSAISIVARHLRSAILHFDLSAARRWLEQLPGDAIDAHPQLAVDNAWLALFAERNDLSSQISRAQAAIAAFDFSAQSAQHSARNELHAEIGVLHGLSLYVEMRLDAAHAVAADVHRLPYSDSGLAAGYLHLLDALLENHPENLDARLRSVHSAANIFRRLGFVHATVDAALWPCILKRRYGDIVGACASFENAFAVMHHFGREQSAVATDVHNQYGEHLYFMGRISDARVHFEQARSVASRIAPQGIAAYHAALGLQLCDLADGVALSEFDQADDARCWAAAVSDNVPLVAVSAGMLRILRDFQLGTPDRCRQTADSFGISPTQLTPDVHEWLRLLVFTGAVTGGEFDDALETSLRAFHSEMLSIDNRVIAGRIQALLVLLLLNRGDESQARNEFATLKSIAETLSLPRLISDFPPLSALHNRRLDPWSPTEFGLSRAEVRVLQLIIEEFSNKQIAAALSISLNTVNTHVQNLFRKLGVHSRAEAVRAARAVGIGGE